MASRKHLRRAAVKPATPRARRAIAPSVRQLVLLEAGYKCANPSCRHVLTLELHHIEWVRDGGGNDPANLLALCPNCHSLHTQAHIPAAAIAAWKGLLLSLNNPNRAVADVLLVLHDEECRVRNSSTPEQTPPPLRFTGDGLTVLAGLLTSGLVSISRRFSGVSMFGGGMPSFEVALTDSGRALVAAWRAGDPEGIRDALTVGAAPVRASPST